MDLAGNKLFHSNQVELLSDIHVKCKTLSLNLTFSFISGFICVFIWHLIGDDSSSSAHESSHNETQALLCIQHIHNPNPAIPLETGHLNN